MEFDAGLYERQMAGIAALITLANDVATASRSSETGSWLAEGKRKQGRLAELWTQLRQDQMMWNSLYLVVNAGLMAGFGFAFWILTAHLFSVGDVGRASALISATGLIGNCALFGLNTGMGKYLPDSRNPNALISSGLSVVAVCGAIGAMIYLLLIPVIAPGLSFVEKSPALAAGFVLITSASSLNTLTDSIFVALRRAKYTAFVDGIVGGFGKVIFALVLAGAGAYGLFTASAMGIVLASVASLVIIYTVMHSRLDLKRPLSTLQPLFRFAGANYVGNVLNMVPGLAVPIILLDRLGASSAAYFFVVFQIVQIVYAAALALEQTFLAEGSRADADMRGLKRRSIRMLVMFCVPAAVVIIAAGRFLLLAFGRPYLDNGFASLIILSLSAGPIAANYWLLTVLRLAGKLRAIVVVNAIYASATCIFTWIGTSHGLAGVATGWFLGAFIATCAGAVAAREGRDRVGTPYVDSGVANGRQPPVERGGRPRLDRPANPTGAGYGRPAPGGVNSNGSGRRGSAEQPRRLQPPVNPFGPGYRRADPGLVNGGYLSPGSGERRRVERPADPAGPAYGQAGHGAVNGRNASRASSERRRVERPVDPAGPGYGRADPGLGYGRADPGPFRGPPAHRGNNGRPGPDERSADPNDPAYDPGTLNRDLSGWD